MRIEVVPTEGFSLIQSEALDRLGNAVYPPQQRDELPGSAFSWAAPKWSVLLWDRDELVSRAGLHLRQVLQDGVSKQIGGIGGVMTHPHRQGQGFGSQVMRAAARHLEQDLGVAFALLFCRTQLVRFYGGLSWKLFQGKVFVEQPGGRIQFTANEAMLLDASEAAPSDGLLDLNGLPW